MKICPKCQTEFQLGSGNHCSRACANRRVLSEETKEKIRSSLSKPPRASLACPNCDGPMDYRSVICRRCPKKGTKHTQESKEKISRGLKGKTGGWRNFGGSGKKGTVDGMIYQSSWELAWILYHRDHGIAFERCTENFPYEFKGQTRKYHPDFKIGEKYVEVKGVIDEKTAAKFSQFPRDKVLEVFDRNAMKPILDWAIEKYGKEFASVM